MELYPLTEIGLARQGHRALLRTYININLPYDRFRQLIDRSLSQEVSIDKFVDEFVNRTYNLRFGTQEFP